ncbi:MAG TPA: hypothetical protein VEC99_03975 [Clostridia bacterium]|nr:hypothetical protein [Clostridia bacterium]
MSEKRRALFVLLSIAGVLLQGIGLMMSLARTSSNVHATYKTSASVTEGVLVLGGCAAMLVGLCFYAKSKGRTWFWGLCALFPFVPFAGFFIGAAVLFLLPDKTRHEAN